MPNIPEIKARYEAATPEPWRAGYKDGSAPHNVMTVAERKSQTKVGVRVESGKTKRGKFVSFTRDDSVPPILFPPTPDAICETDSDDLSEAEQLANADFIAHARSDVPALVTALEEAQGRFADGTGTCYCDTVGETPCAYCQIATLEGKLGAIREAAALAPSLPASTILDILGESQ